MEKPRYKIEKLDQRYRGYGVMKYYVEVRFSMDAVEEFYTLKTWCTEQWGITRPLHDWMTGSTKHPRPKDVNPSWTYIRDDYRKRIMLKDKEEAMLFALRWGSNI